MTNRCHSRHIKLAVPAVAVAAVIATAAAGMPAAQASSSPGWRVTWTLSAKNTELDTLAALKGGTAWAGGETPAQLPVVYHLVSGKWHATVLPGTTGTFVSSVSATSPTNVWAALANTPAVEHLTTKGWVAHTFAIGSDQILIDGVVTISPKDTVVFAYDFATKLTYTYGYNGKQWSRRLIPDAVTANGDTGLVSATSSSNIWALTFVGTRYASLRFNGKKWQVINFPGHLAPAGTTVFTRQILAESPKNVWATIYTVAAKHVGPVVLLHWNGRAWSKVGGRLPKAALTGPIASDGSGGLWLAASNTAFTKALMLHYAGGKWSTHNAPTDLKKMLDISQLSLVPGTHTVLGAAIIGLTFGGTSGSAFITYGR